MTTKSWRVRAIGSMFSFDSNSPSENELRISNSSQYPTQFNFKGKFFRGGIDYQYKSLKASADYVLNVGDYSEVGPDGSFTHSFNNNTISLALKNEFESTVALGAVININGLKTHSTLSPPSVDTNITDVRYGGMLEFLF